MRTALSSNCLLGGVCLSACWDTPCGCGPGDPLGCGPGDNPPGCGPGGPLGVAPETPLGVCLETTPLDVGLETCPGQTPQLPPWVWAWRPPRLDPSTSPWVWAWRPPQAKSLGYFPPGCGPGDLQGMLGYYPPRPARYAGIPPCEQNSWHTSENITLPQLRCGGKNYRLLICSLEQNYKYHIWQTRK